MVGVDVMVMTMACVNVVVGMNVIEQAIFSGNVDVQLEEEYDEVQ
jgi:hypothetical protein